MSPVESSERSLVDTTTAKPTRKIHRILIVEDCANDAELMVHELQKHGLEIVWTRVATEREFLAELSYPPDLILADYSMPGFGAVRALEILQARSLAIPFILVSGTIGEEAAISIVRLGASDYVLKTRLTQLGPRAALAIEGRRKIAYFSMEIALESAIPTYSGGLGILAGDTIRSAADLQVPMVALTLVHRKGYFRQHLDASGWQSEEPVRWKPEEFLEELSDTFSILIEGRPVQLRVWKYEVRGIGGYVVPVFLMDTDLPGNSDWDRRLTDVLYGGDSNYRMCQEVVLGIGGMQVLRGLGYDRIERFHMNEGHASLLTMALLREHAQQAGRDRIDINDMAAVREKCIFTTHTPVPAGHDQFSLDAVGRVLWQSGDPSKIFCSDVAAKVFGRRGSQADAKPDANVNMTYLGLNMSRYINGVAKKHGEVSRIMFGGYQIDAITNGVHVGTWTCPPMQALFDRYIQDWRQDNFSLRYAASIPKHEIWDAHLKAKEELVQLVNQRERGMMSADIFTVGFARRVTAYKRPDLLFFDIARLKRICQKFGSIQVVLSGKAHPSDKDGKDLIQKVLRMKEQLDDKVVISFIEDYDMNIAKRMVSGVDLWLNTPQPPLEASGTSGMKAALNGVPSLSILDGWWIEGHIEGITGWSIVSDQLVSREGEGRSADCLYRKLEEEIIPLFYRDTERYITVMQHAIALNGSFFNTQRMLQQYVLRAYFS